MNYMSENQLECSSGCESGWTHYLQHSSSSSSSSYSISSYNREKKDYNINETRRNKNGAFTRSKQDEDMSMVSDASSGPPHLHEQELEIYGGNYDNAFHHCPSDESLSRNKKENKEKRRRKVQQHSSNLLDDTASSPFFDFSNHTLKRDQPYVENVLEYSQGYSTTQFEVVRPSYQEHYDFFQASTPGNQRQQNQWLEDKRW